MGPGRSGLQSLTLGLFFKHDFLFLPMNLRIEELGFNWLYIKGLGSRSIDPNHIFWKINFNCWLEIDFNNILLLFFYKKKRG